MRGHPDRRKNIAEGTCGNNEGRTKICLASEHNFHMSDKATDAVSRRASPKIIPTVFPQKRSLVVDNPLLARMMVPEQMERPRTRVSAVRLVKAWVAVSSVLVLVVEDFESFRRFVCTELGKRPDLQIVAEASDGLEAVQKAVELKPDLILLDIRLPKLNGIEAARQIRNLVPESRIIFLTQESSADVVQEALSLGAQGYVVKTNAPRELLNAVEAVLSGRTFVSSGIGN